MHPQLRVLQITTRGTRNQEWMTEKLSNHQAMTRAAGSPGTSGRHGWEESAYRNQGGLSEANGTETSPRLEEGAAFLQMTPDAPERGHHNDAWLEGPSARLPPLKDKTLGLWSHVNTLPSGVLLRIKD